MPTTTMGSSTEFEPLDSIVRTATDESTLLTLVVFFSAADPTCLRLLTSLERWQQLYYGAGLRLLMIYSPHFSFERSAEYVTEQSALASAPWPIVVDADDRLVRSAHVRLWPTVRLLSRTSTLLHESVGNGQVSQTEQVIRTALVHAGAHALPPPTDSDEHTHRLGNLCLPSHPDVLTGTQRGQYKNTHAVDAGNHHYTDPLDGASFGLSLDGDWRVTDERLESTNQTAPTDYLSFVFAGYLVSALLQSLTAAPARVAITLGGQPLVPSQAGIDVQISTGQSIVTVDQPRLYQLLTSDEYLAPADLRLYPADGQFAAYLLSASGCR